MKALSIRQPWVHAILNFGKRIENREWEVGSGNVYAARRIIAEGGVFLIHAAKGCAREEYLEAGEFMRDAYRARPWEGSTILPAPDKLTRGALVARARLVGLARLNPFGHRASGMDMRCSACGADADSTKCPKLDPWANPGALGLILADVEPLAVPIPLKGFLGFFDVPDAAQRGAS